jgi:D-specific alpha-keto acid dehydrogenase
VLTSGGGRSGDGAQVGSLAQLLRESDVVTLHLPLTPDTHHLIGREELATMRRGAVLVNTARGGLVHTAALVDALERGHLGGAALDVLEDEGGVFYVDHSGAPVPHRHLGRLAALPNMIVTPHAAYFTARTLHETVEQTLANSLRFERNRTDAQTEDRDLVRGLLRGA